MLCDEYSLKKRLYDLEGEPGSSVSVVFGYGLGDRAIEALLGIKDKVKEIE
jgi:hypothetical protein